MIHSRSFALPPADRQEILRYAGTREETPELSGLLNEVLTEAEPVLTGKVCWMEYPIRQEDAFLDLGFARVDSAALKRTLSGCDQIILFAATVGLGLDRLIIRYGHVSPAKALLLQALGAERIEALCNTFCETVRQEAHTAGLKTTPRFSPGYGDVSLSLQSDIFRVLDCSRKIGLTLNDSYLMSPTKSVTAIIGLGPCAGSDPQTSCSRCSKTDCAYRRIP